MEHNQLFIGICGRGGKMADWKLLLKRVLLADGVIDAEETKILKNEIYADGIVDEEEKQFLIDLRNSATKPGPEFEKFFFEALKKNILADGVVDAKEAGELREIIFADNVVDENEKKFLKSLRSEAKEVSPEFEKLLRDCLKN